MPLGERLVWEAIDKVDADVAEARMSQQGDGLAGLLGVVSTVEELEQLVVEGLYAHAHPVDGQRGEQLSEVWRDVVGVALNGYLSGTGAVDMLEEPFQLVMGEAAWCSSPYIDRRPVVRSSEGQFFAEGVDILVGEMEKRRGVEGAVGAPAFAERDVNIESAHMSTKGIWGQKY